MRASERETDAPDSGRSLGGSGVTKDEAETEARRQTYAHMDAAGGIPRWKWLPLKTPAGEWTVERTPMRWPRCPSCERELVNDVARGLGLPSLDDLKGLLLGKPVWWLGRFLWYGVTSELHNELKADSYRCRSCRALVAQCGTPAKDLGWGCGHAWVLHGTPMPGQQLRCPKCDRRLRLG